MYSRLLFPRHASATERRENKANPFLHGSAMCNMLLLCIAGSCFHDMLLLRKKRENQTNPFLHGPAMCSMPLLGIACFSYHGVLLLRKENKTASSCVWISCARKACCTSGPEHKRFSRDCCGKGACVCPVPAQVKKGNRNDFRVATCWRLSVGLDVVGRV